MQFDTNSDKARFSAIQKWESSEWFHALSSTSIGTLLDNNAYRIAVGLRLGTDICEPHKYIDVALLLIRKGIVVLNISKINHKIICIKNLYLLLSISFLYKLFTGEFSRFFLFLYFRISFLYNPIFNFQFVHYELID